MNNFIAISGMTFLMFLCGLQARVLHAQEPDDILKLKFGRQITAEDAQALEEGLKTKPDDLPAREKLVLYYFQAQLKSRAPELEEKREEHVFWLIEHHPESELAGSPETGIMPMSFTGSVEGYQRGKQLWLEQVEKHPDNKQILENASNFLLFADRKTARELLEKALALDPGDIETSSKLAQTYDLDRIEGNSSEENKALAEKSLSIRERGLAKAGDEQRFDELGALAKAAFEAGEMEKAEQYANELLQSAPKFKGDWNYGNALHDGNTILGRIALQRGDIVGAKQHLLAAGETPGSPQLDSFGPNVALAKELLEKGERETVLTYLQSCEKFWKMGGKELQNWIATIKGGGTPDFRMNLRY
jgi:tetratricopeptide (TPR) repeat protein